MELIEIYVRHQTLTPAQVHRAVVRQKNFHHILDQGYNHHWKVYSFEEQLQHDIHPGATSVKWTILVNSTHTVQIGCVFAQTPYKFS